MATTTGLGNPVLLATAIVNGLVALGHTAKGREQFQHASIKQLPPALRGAVTTGWYEGSVFFAIAGLLNYKWYTSGLTHPIDKVIAALLAALSFGAGANYFRTGDKPTSMILAIVGALQAAVVKVAGGL